MLPTVRRMESEPAENCLLRGKGECERGKVRFDNHWSRRRSARIRPSTFRLPPSALPFMVTKIEIAADWLTRYTGMPLDRFGNFVLLTNFRDYVQRFAARFACDIYGDNRPMQSSTNDAGLTIINF